MVVACLANTRIQCSGMQLLHIGIHAEQAWQNVGYMLVYVVSNVLATYIIYWLARVPRRTRRKHS